MWASITSFIIRNRLVFLAIMLGVTVFLGIKAKEVKLSYDFPQVIPQTDSDYVYYQRFKQQFGQDGNLMVIGFKSRNAFHPQLFNSWMKLTKDIDSLGGVKSVASIANLPVLQKDQINRRFALRPLISEPISSIQEGDSIRKALLSLPFYHNLFYNDSTGATLMGITLDRETLLSKNRVYLIDSVVALSQAFSEENKLEVHYTGLPYIRTTFANKLQKELNLFLILSVIVTSIILFLFFRTLYNVIFPLLIIGVIITWTLGFVVLLDYRLTMLTGLIPPLIVIIAVPNFIYFLSRYHTEYKKYGIKLKGIIMMTQNIARVIFLNNVTTAIGFGVLYFVNSPVLQEFGVVAFLMITATFVISIVFMPVIFSFLPAPSARHVNYLNSKAMNGFITYVDRIAQTRRKSIYAIAIILLGVAIVGVNKLEAVGYIMDDIPAGDKLATDLSFFEENFNGVMPFEIVINTHKERGLLDLNILNKISQLEDSIEAMPEFGNAMSLADVTKYTTQAFFNGAPQKYAIPQERELQFLNPYLRAMELTSNNGMGLSIVDSTLQTTRITAKMADVGTVRLQQIVDRLDKDMKVIFDSTDVTYRFTGFSLVSLKGNGYLIDNLATSLVMAILLIIGVIAFLFPSLRLVLITLLPNCLALLVTMGLMGYFHIPLKPSSVLVFSIAFGIAIDASFHFLVNYRQDLKNHNWDIPKTISISLRETGFSIVYTSLVLFFGFGIFCFSSFGSTISLGALTAITILCAMFTNIILIPALLISFDRKSRRSRMK